jgi:hypothetical protein
VQHGLAAKTYSKDTRKDIKHGHVAWTFGTDMHHGCEALASSMFMKDGHEAWTCSMEMQRGNADRTCRIYMHGQAEWKCMNMTEM